MIIEIRTIADTVKFKVENLVDKTITDVDTFVAAIEAQTGTFVYVETIKGKQYFNKAQITAIREYVA